MVKMDQNCRQSSNSSIHPPPSLLNNVSLNALTLNWVEFVAPTYKLDIGRKLKPIWILQLFALWLEQSINWITLDGVPRVARVPRQLSKQVAQTIAVAIICIQNTVLLLLLQPGSLSQTASL